MLVTEMGSCRSCHIDQNANKHIVLDLFIRCNFMCSAVLFIALSLMDASLGMPVAKAIYALTRPRHQRHQRLLSRQKSTREGTVFHVSEPTREQNRSVSIACAPIRRQTAVATQYHHHSFIQSATRYTDDSIATHGY